MTKLSTLATCSLALLATACGAAAGATATDSDPIGVGGSPEKVAALVSTTETSAPVATEATAVDLTSAVDPTSAIVDTTDAVQIAEVADGTPSTDDTTDTAADSAAAIADLNQTMGEAVLRKISFESNFLQQICVGEHLTEDPALGLLFFVSPPGWMQPSEYDTVFSAISTCVSAVDLVASTFDPGQFIDPQRRCAMTKAIEGLGYQAVRFDLTGGDVPTAEQMRPFVEAC